MVMVETRRHQFVVVVVVVVLITCERFQGVAPYSPLSLSLSNTPSYDETCIIRMRLSMSLGLGVSVLCLSVSVCLSLTV